MNKNALYAEYELWAADLMKYCSKHTKDPQLKEKYEQIAALNRMLFEKISKNSDTEKISSDLDFEIKMLKRAYFCQKALHLRFCECMTYVSDTQIIDEMVDRQTIICRDLLSEIKLREKVKKIKTLEEIS